MFLETKIVWANASKKNGNQQNGRLIPTKFIKICLENLPKSRPALFKRWISAIHRINRYPADSVIDLRNTYPLDSDLSGG